MHRQILYAAFSGRNTNKLSQWVFNLIFLSMLRSISNCFYFSSVGACGLQDIIIKSHKTKHLMTFHQRKNS